MIKQLFIQIRINYNKIKFKKKLLFAISYLQLYFTKVLFNLTKTNVIDIFMRFIQICLLSCLKAISDSGERKATKILKSANFSISSDPCLCH